jgi:hypothetical protein
VSFAEWLSRDPPRGPPGRPGLVEIEPRGDLAQALEPVHGRFGGLSSRDLLLERGGVHFRAVVGSDQTTDFVGGAVDLRRALGGGAVEQNVFRVQRPRE